MLDDIELNWPKRTDSAFGPRIEGDDDLRTVACIDWLLGNPDLGVRADGLKRAADIIVEGLSEGKSEPSSCDVFFFPIAYLYRHSVELLLKEAIRYGAALGLVTRDVKLERLLKSHNLYALWNKLKPAIQAVWPAGPPEELRAAERIIAQFHKIDRTGQAFRYPAVKSGTAASKSGDTLNLVDLVQLSKVAGGICNFLDGCISGFDNALSNLPSSDW